MFLFNVLPGIQRLNKNWEFYENYDNLRCEFSQFSWISHKSLILDISLLASETNKSTTTTERPHITVKTGST